MVEERRKAKPRAKSKTLWLGALVSGLGAAMTYLPEAVPVTYVGPATFVLGVAITVLRELTNAPVGGNK